MALPSPSLPPGNTHECFRLLVENIQDYAILVLDPEGRVAEWNEGATRIIGYTPAEVCGHYFSFLYTPEDQQAGKPARELQVALAEGRSEDESWRVRKDGSRFWGNEVVAPLHDAAGKLHGFTKITRDLTERKQAEDALRESEERQRLLVEGVTEYAIFMADPQGRIMTWNSGAERILGYREAEILGQPLALLFTPEDQAKGEPEREQATALAQGQALDERWHQRQDGRRFWASGVLTPLRDDLDHLRGFVQVLRDNTERRQIEESLRQSEARLAAANARLTSALARERNIAVALQRSLTQMPAEAVLPGFHVQAVYEPAREEAEVGGDFVDAFLLDEEHLAVVVGDASGKGLEAAARVAEIKYILRGMLAEHRSPAAALVGLNEYLCGASQRGAASREEFVCGAVVVVAQRTGAVIVSVAGAEPPLFVRLDGSIQEAQVRGVPVGLFSGGEYREEASRLESGDLLLLTTDGITEARRQGEFFGYEGLAQAAVRRRHTPELTALAADLLHEARAFAAGALQDDACLLLLRRA